MSALLVNDEEDVRRIWLNRPKKLNAIRREDMVQMKTLVEEAEGSVDAIVFGGVGDRAFSAGVHFEEFVDLSVGEARALISELGLLLGAVHQSPVATVCAINGYCLGGAMELAMACDIRIAARHARFGMPEVKLGIPFVLNAALLQQHIGLSKAKEMLLTGDSYGTDEMERYGLLNKVVESDVLKEEVELFLARIISHSRTAIAAQKRLFESWQNTGLQEAINSSVSEFALAFGEDETQETIKKYVAELKGRECL